MKQADLIKELERLKERVAALEARPVYVPVPQYVPYSPPTYPMYPWITYTTGSSSGSIDPS